MTNQDADKAAEKIAVDAVRLAAEHPAEVLAVALLARLTNEGRTALAGRVRAELYPALGMDAASPLPHPPSQG